MKSLFREIIFVEKKKKILFDINLFDNMRRYLQVQDDTRESGGILLGSVCKDNLAILVTEMTVPYEDDFSRRNSFIRQSFGHIKLYNERYTHSQKTCLYIGEWHTHPEDIPDFSKVDEDNWKSISNSNEVFPMQIHVIAGRVAIRFWAVCKNEMPVLLDTFMWAGLV